MSAITHKLKILPQYFLPVSLGDKTFEIRKNDRNFQVGDNIDLVEFVPGENGGIFTDRVFYGRITYITDYEQKQGYVVFSFIQRK